ncbi:MAG: hypothetical protein HZB16_07405 [Armatimonadetes bacterium]|nr:hypothetical protein [Armatimonadota bacterium]
MPRAELWGVAAAALVAYLVWSLIWPIGAGRDFESYVMTLLELPRRVADYPFQSAFRTPLTPLFLGFVCGSGRWVAGLVLLAGYVLVALSVHALVRPRHRGAAWLAVVLWLVSPAGGWMFRHPDSATLTAMLIAPWAVAISRSDERTTAAGWAGRGALAAALVLARPANLVFGGALLAPLLIAGLPLGRRLGHVAAFALALVLPLQAWCWHNAALYQDWVVSRGSGAFMPLARVMAFDDLVRPENGPASARLAEVVQRRLLPRDFYRRQGIDVQRFFRLRATGPAGDLISACDQEWGWDCDYAPLRAVAMEAIARHPGLYARRVAADVWALFAAPLPRRVADVDLSGAGAWSWLESRPAGYPPPRCSGQSNVVELYRASRFAAFAETADARPAWRWLTYRYDKAQLPMLPWLVLGAVGLWPYRARRERALALLVWLAVAGLVITELGMWLIPEYRWPFDSLFLAYGTLGLARWLPTSAGSPPSAPR